LRKILQVFAIVLFVVPVSLTLGAEQAAAQGPAGSGATAAAQDGSHSLNPIKWVKKDSKNSIDASGNRSDAEKKLTPNLRAQGLLAANATTSEACEPFLELVECLAVLHASRNL